MQFALFSSYYLQQLGDCELVNRAWFASLFEPREHDFYWPQGVQQHIVGELDKVSNRSAFCGLHIKDNQIVATANLPDIFAKKGLLG